MTSVKYTVNSDTFSKC